MNGAVPVCLGFTGLVGLLVLVGALNPWARSHPFTIRADATGLTQNREHISWHAVAGIARLDFGAQAFYDVRSAIDDTAIMWAERWVSSTSSAVAGTPVTSTELAAVVSARSGKPIQSAAPRGLRSRHPV